MQSYEKLLLENKAWAREKTEDDPEYFNRLSHLQTPEFLWIRSLKVKHVIVCGHYGCGGIKAAMTNHDYKQVLNMWLRNIKDVYRLHREELEKFTDEENKFDRLVELNVKEQVKHLANTSIIQRAWKNEQRPDLHGWVYGLKDGIINPVFEMKAGTHIDPLYEYDDL